MKISVRKGEFCDRNYSSRLAQFIGKGSGALLRGNGTAIAGKDVIEALARSVYLEESAMFQLKAKQIGRPLYFTPEEVAERGTVALQTPHMLRAWEHYCRRLPHERSGNRNI
ncbi:MAG: hypothetical protein ABSC55_27810 [Syntrophorhabdales bacterium]